MISCCLSFYFCAFLTNDLLSPVQFKCTKACQRKVHKHSESRHMKNGWVSEQELVIRNVQSYLKSSTQTLQVDITQECTSDVYVNCVSGERYSHT